MSLKKDVFKNWREEQGVYKHVDISSMKKHLEKRNIEKLKRKLFNQISDLQTLGAIFDPSCLGDFFSEYKIPSVKKLQEEFFNFYSLIERDMSEFVSYLEEHDFKLRRMNSAEKRQGINAVVKKYSDIFDILFDQNDEDKKDEILFTIANKFFEFCFYPKTFSRFKKMLAESEYHPIVRLLYSIMWSNLSEIGWQHWHFDALKILKKEADAGKQIVYIAGGTDIYQLIKHGIYNIRVIDPMLPTQPKYYSQGWDWFINGKIGESVLLSTGSKKLVFERANYHPTGEFFNIKLSNNKKEKIEQSVTTWNLYEQKSKKLLGKVVFDRRLTNQDDFVVLSKQSLLVSFNELYFIAAPKGSDGWGINPHKFSDNIKIIVKQLRQPVGKKIVCNLRHEVKQSGFAFISLGSCVD